MKKKIIVLIMLILIVVGFVIYARTNFKTENNKIVSNTENNNTNIQNNQEDNEKKIISDSKILVAYFSKAGENYSVGTVNKGNTEIMAENIANIVRADLYKIEPINDYPNSYNEATEVAKEEQNNNARPDIKNKLSNIDDYDIIFIGYPIWWGDMPQILYTFLESYDFSGKTIIPFNTHEGSGNAGTYSTIEAKLSNSNILEGLAIRGKEAREDSSKNTIQNWLNKIGF